MNSFWALRGESERNNFSKWWISKKIIRRNNWNIYIKKLILIIIIIILTTKNKLVVWRMLFLKYCLVATFLHLSQSGKIKKFNLYKSLYTMYLNIIFYGICIFSRFFFILTVLELGHDKDGSPVWKEGHYRNRDGNRNLLSWF